MSGFSFIKANSPQETEIVEIPFESGQEAQLESLIEDQSETLPITEINPTAKIAVPIGRQVTVGTNILDLLFISSGSGMRIALLRSSPPELQLTSPRGAKRALSEASPVLSNEC